MKKTSLLLLTALLGSAATAETYELPASPTTVAWGHYDPKAKPVLTVKSGDRVVMHTLITSSPDRLEGAGVAPGMSNRACATSRHTSPTRGRAGIS
jgi:hypothetical protein